MWNFFRRNPETLTLEEIITSKSTDIKVNEFLFEHGKWMIANCIAKSEIYTVVDKKNEKSDMYYLLNIRPNPNQTATEFWLDVINKYFSHSAEALIVEVGGYLYVADSYTKSRDILYSKIFSDVTVTMDGDSLKLGKTFTAEDTILIRRKDKKVDVFLNMLNDKIADLMIASFSAYKSKSPKYLCKVPAGINLQSADGTPLTGDDYSKTLEKKIDSSKVSILRLANNMDLEYLKNGSSVTPEEFKNIYNQAATNVAMALNIPINAFIGTITEKSDAIDELITFAVSIIVEQINDAMNYCLMGKESYLNGSKIGFDLSTSKHRDILSNASAIDKLVADGFSHNEILEFFKKPTIDEDWANEHNITKNYAPVDTKGGEET